MFIIKLREKTIISSWDIVRSISRTSSPTPYWGFALVPWTKLSDFRPRDPVAYNLEPGGPWTYTQVKPHTALPLPFPLPRPPLSHPSVSLSFSFPPLPL